MRPEKIKRVFIAGGGIMGSSMAESFAGKGFEVTIFDIAQEFLDKARTLIDLHQQTQIATGEISREDSQALVGRISFTLDMQQFAKADMVVEAIVEKIEVKAAFYTNISRYVPDHALVASNTSALPITELAKSYKKPENFCGMHWFNPPHIIPLIEVTFGARTSEETAQAVYDTAVFLGKKPVFVRKDPKGFIANRIQFAIMREALHIVDQGYASFEDVDRVMTYALGFRYALFGPFAIADFGGLDTFYHISKFLNPDFCNRTDVSPTLEERFLAGRLGVKTKEGFYEYPDGRDVEQIKLRDTLYTKLFNMLYKES